MLSHLHFGDFLLGETYESLKLQEIPKLPSCCDSLSKHSHWSTLCTGWCDSKGHPPSGPCCVYPYSFPALVFPVHLPPSHLCASILPAGPWAYDNPVFDLKLIHSQDVFGFYKAACIFILNWAPQSRQLVLPQYMGYVDYRLSEPQL